MSEIFDGFRFTFQQKKQIEEFIKDIKMWGENLPDEIENSEFVNKKSSKEIFNFMRDYHKNLKESLHSYKNFSTCYKPKNFKISSFKSPKIALGSCPVASQNTRCCNLMTLDAINSCGFDCSYCSIQSFYKGGTVEYDENFAKNLENLELEEDKIYHIGTGQSSDSLMWNNKFGELEALIKFAKKHKNLILEFKSKSKNISYLLENEIPRNIIVTFSLNSPVIIENEEHLAASLDERISSAKILAKKGILVGFHFHPLVWYDDFFADYGKVFDRILSEFEPKNVAMISLGTLTFIKPVIKKLRERELKSKILQMPFELINGKFSYPLEIKRQMFSFAYERFKPWHEHVFFYLCMEEKSLWRECLGYEYESNDEFESAMKSAYLDKIRSER